MLTLLTLLACGPKGAPIEPMAAAVPDYRSSMPEPLAPREFVPPAAEEGTLSNGLRVVVSPNHEVPKVYVTVALKAGAWTDPVKSPGLASVTMDMLNEGAGGMSAEQLSLELRKLATDLGASAGLDGSSVSMSCLHKNLEPSLDLLATVLLKPDLPKSEWTLMQKQRLQDLKAAREDPNSIASRVWDTVLWGDGYAGHNTTEAGYKAITVKDMRRWYGESVVPGQALLLVGGDTTLAEITSLLEARLGSWKGSGDKVAAAAAKGFPYKQPETTTIYLVDKPGAAQSVLRAGRFVGEQADPDWMSFYLANMAVGGQFTARINMNLREDKGYTYGARAGAGSYYTPDAWVVSTSVKTDTTKDSVSEILRELRESIGDRPITEAEVEAARGSVLGTYPLRFESPGFLLGQASEMWRYGLPDDWLSGYTERVRAATVESANAAWKARVDPDKLAILVVGDASVVKPGLEELGLPLVMLDADGAPQ